MSDSITDLQNVINQCENFLSKLNPQVGEIDEMRATVDKACEFRLSGGASPSSLSQDFMSVERAYSIVSKILGLVEEGKVIRKRLSEAIKQATVRSSSQSSTDKRNADADFNTGKFSMELARFEGFFRYCEKRLDALSQRYYTVRASLTSIEQEIKIGGMKGSGASQIASTASAPKESLLTDPNTTPDGSNKSWNTI